MNADECRRFFLGGNIAVEFCCCFEVGQFLGSLFLTADVGGFTRMNADECRMFLLGGKFDFLFGFGRIFWVGNCWCGSC